VIRTVLWGVFTVALVIAVLTLRVVVGGELEIMESSRALMAGDAREAAVHARSAALWYAPGAPHVRVAYERLFALGKAAEEHHDKEVALFAYRSVMEASAGTRWIVVPHAADADRAAARIADLSPSMPRPPATSLEPAAVIEKRELEAITRETGPRMPWVFALAGSFIVWVSGLLVIIFRGLDGAGRFAFSRARLGVALTTIGVAVWLTALYWA
jgi:hypothetical protein